MKQKVFFQRVLSKKKLQREYAGFSGFILYNITTNTVTLL